MVVELYWNEAPNTCRNFAELARRGYYNSTKFHRLVKDFIVQGGDPTGTGRGGSSIYGKYFDDEINSSLKHTGMHLASRPRVFSWIRHWTDSMFCFRRWNIVHGQCWPKYQRLTVFHNFGANTVARQNSYDLRTFALRDSRFAEDIVDANSRTWPTGRWRNINTSLRNRMKSMRLVQRWSNRR